MMLRRESRPFEVTFGAGGFLFLVVIGLAVGGGAFGVGYWLGRENAVPVVSTPAKPDLSLIRDPLAPTGAGEKIRETTEAQRSQRSEGEENRGKKEGAGAGAEAEAARGARAGRREVIARPSAVSVRPGITAARRMYTVQVKSVPTRAEADAFATRVREAGFVPFVVEADIKKKKWFRVRVGEFATADEAEAARKKLIAIARDAIVSHD
ncbi:MAG: SPOR domain-containing protein [Deltaproteobacteria bacterium]|nr:SPOR domain-containing protein [Deltaproteobacteria bacterium]